MPIPAPTLFVDRSQRSLHDGAGLRFAGGHLGWQPAAEKFGGDPIDPVAAVRWLQKESGSPSRQAVGVVVARVVLALDGDAALPYASRDA